MQPLAWPINTSVFANLLMQEWAKALINPRSFLGVPIEKILEFQLAALISMDHIWMARNKFIHGSVRPDPHTCLQVINVSFWKQLKAWKNKNAHSSSSAPSPSRVFQVQL
jgi:hypothetical protein